MIVLLHMRARSSEQIFVSIARSVQGDALPDRTSDAETAVALHQLLAVMSSLRPTIEARCS